MAFASQWHDDYARALQPAPLPKRTWTASGNSSGTSSISRWPGDSWDAYDALPPAVRQMLQDKNQDYCPGKTSQLLQPILKLISDPAVAASLFIAAQAEAEALEVQKFAEAYKKTFGTAYPHTAAEASIMRWSSKDLHAHQGVARNSLLEEIVRTDPHPVRDVGLARSDRTAGGAATRMFPEA